MARRHASGRNFSGKRLAGSRRRLAVERLEERRLLAITVDTHLDVVDVNDGVTSLREAIFAANTAGGADTIDFAASLTANGPVTIPLTQGELAITEALTIDGPGSSLLTIDAQQQSRIFNITATTGDFAIGGLKLINGRTTGSQSSSSTVTTFNGGAVRLQTSGATSFEDTVVTNSHTTGANAKGGAISARGALTLLNSHLLENGTSGDLAHGGAIYSSGSLTIIGSQIGGNAVGGDDSLGSGIYSEGMIFINGSSVEQNVATGSSFGSAIYGLNTVSLVDSEVSRNVRGVAVVATKGATLVDAKVLTNEGGGVTTDFSSTRSITLLRSVVSGNTKSGPIGGAGLYTLGSVELQASEVSHNQMTGDGGNGGGIVARSGGLSAVDSVIAHNSTAGIHAYGGGVFTQARVTLSNTRLEGNYTTGTLSYAGAVFADDFVAVNNCVISGNYTTGGNAGGGAVRARLATIEDSVVDGNWTNGAVASGGAIQTERLKVLRSSFVNNSTSGHHAPGGAVYAFDAWPGSTLEIADSTFRGNFTHGANASGGGIFGRTLTITIDRSSFVGNGTTDSAAKGGGLHIEGNSGTIANSIISGNSTAGINADGGGIYSITPSLTFRSSSISGNHTAGNDADGGGVRGSASFQSSSIVGNCTLGDRSRGGGVFNIGSIGVTESTVSGNSTSGSQSHGGGISGGVFAIRSTISENHVEHSSSYGGGVYGASQLYGSILAGNSAAGDTSDIKGNVLSQNLKFCLIGDRTGTSLNEAPIGSPDANGNLVGGPVNGVIDAKLGPLTNNGGPTKSHALLPGSPALDAGDPAAVAGVSGVPEFDQRGGPWSRVAGGRIDMGAIESQANPLAGDYNFNGVVDLADYSVWRDTVGSVIDLRADGSGAMAGVPDGVVDQLDYEFWKASFGNVLVAGLGAGNWEQGGSSQAAGQRFAGEDIAELNAESAGTIGAAIGGGRRAAGPRLVEVRGARFVQANAAETEGLLAWVAARPDANGEREHRGNCGTKAAPTSPESSHALDDVFASIGNAFGQF